MTSRRGGASGAALASLLLVLGCSERTLAPPRGNTEFDVIEVPGDATLAEAVQMASKGDTIRISGGVPIEVSETVVVPPGKDGIVIVGRASAARGTSARPEIVADVGTTAILRIASGVDDVEVRGLDLSGTFGTGIWFEETGGIASDCYIRGAGSVGIALTGRADPTIARNIVEDAGLFGIQCTQLSSGVISQNTIVGAGDCGLISNGAFPLMELNLIYGSVNYGVACFGSVFPTFSCNLVHMSGTSNFSASCPPRPDGVEEDPLFCSDGSFAVEPTSPCVPGAACDTWIGAVHATCAVRAERDR